MLGRRRRPDVRLGFVSSAPIAMAREICRAGVLRTGSDKPRNAPLASDKIHLFNFEECHPRLSLLAAPPNKCKAWGGRSRKPMFRQNNVGHR